MLAMSAVAVLMLALHTGHAKVAATRISVATPDARHDCRLLSGEAAIVACR
jgi:hypothetical protein